MGKSRMIGRVVACLTVSWLVCIATADAAGYLKLGDIKGEAAADGHKDWIDLSSFTSSAGSYDARGRLTARTDSGSANRGTLTLTKRVDKASPKLQEALTSGAHLRSAEVDVCDANRCVHYTLTDVTVAGFTRTRESEELSLNYGKIEWEPAAPAAATIQAAPANPVNTGVSERLRHKDR